MAGALTEVHVKKLIRAALACGLHPGQFEIRWDGNALVLRTRAGDVDDEPLNEWDAVLTGGSGR